MKSKLFLCLTVICLAILVEGVKLHSQTPRRPRYKKGQTVKLFEKYDFDHGKWKIYLHFSPYSIMVPMPTVEKENKLFLLEDVAVMNQLKKSTHFVFDCSDCGMATPNGGLEFVKDGVYVDRLPMYMGQDELALGNANGEFHIKNYSNFKRYLKFFKPVQTHEAH